MSASGLRDRIGGLVLVGVAAVGITFLGFRGKDEPVAPPGGQLPIEECETGFHIENGACVPDVPDPGVIPAIDRFSQSTDRVIAPGIVGFTVEPRDPRSSIRWNFNDGSKEVINQKVVNHEYFAIGTFVGFVEVIEPDGRTGKIEFNVIVDAPIISPGEEDIISNFTQTQGSIFNGESVGFTVALAVPVDRLIWNFGDGSNVVLNQLSVDHRYNQVGTFQGTVEAIATGGGSEIIPFTVRVEEAPSQLITLSIEIGAAAGSTIEPGENVDFQAQVGGGIQPFVSFDWNFGDGTVERGDNRFPNHVYLTEGTFTVTLTVTDSVGNTQTATKLINVKSLPAQFGDVSITIQETPGSSFDFNINFLNNRSDLTIFGTTLIRVFDGPTLIHTRENSRSIQPLSTISEGLVIRDDWRREVPLRLLVEFNDVNGKLIDDAFLDFTIPEDVGPDPIFCPVGTHEENGVCVPDTIVCAVGFHEENGVCVPDVLPPQTTTQEKDFNVTNFPIIIPQFKTESVQTLLFSVPSNTLDIQFARVFVSARIGYETFASMKIVFNGETVDTIQYGIGESNITKERDIVITSKIKLNQLNELLLVFESSNVFFPAEAFVNLASVFVKSTVPI